MTEQDLGQDAEQEEAMYDAFADWWERDGKARTYVVPGSKTLSYWAARMGYAAGHAHAAAVVEAELAEMKTQKKNSDDAAHIYAVDLDKAEAEIDRLRTEWLKEVHRVSDLNNMVIKAVELLGVLEQALQRLVDANHWPENHSMKDAVDAAQALLPKTKPTGADQCGGSYYTVTDHEASDYPCPSCGRWIAVETDAEGEGYHLAPHPKVQS